MHQRPRFREVGQKQMLSLELPCLASLLHIASAGVTTDRDALKALRKKAKYSAPGCEGPGPVAHEGLPWCRMIFRREHSLLDIGHRLASLFRISPLWISQVHGADFSTISASSRKGGLVS